MEKYEWRWKQGSTTTTSSNDELRDSVRLLPKPGTKSAIWQYFGLRAADGKEQKIKAEVSKYIDKNRLDVEDDPLKWRRVHREQYYLLLVVAKKYLCVPATSTVSKRLFSRSGRIVTPSRSSFKPDKVQMLVFLSKNLK